MRAQSSLVPLAILLSIPVAYAAPLNLNTEMFSNLMGQMWNLIGAIFNFEAISKNQAIARGILKFLVFILILRIVQVLVKKATPMDDNKTAGIIGFVVAAITVIFTPNVYIFSAVVALVVPIAIIGGIAYLALFHKDWFKGSFFKTMMGAILLLIDIFLLQLCYDLFNDWTSAGLAMETRFTPTFVDGVFQILMLVLMILFIYKFISMFFNIGGSRDEDAGEPWAEKFKRWGENVKGWRDFKNVWRGTKVSSVSYIDFYRLPNGLVEVTWEANPNPPENVKYYQVQYTYHPVSSGWSGVWAPIPAVRTPSRTDTKITFPNIKDQEVMFRVRAITTHNEKGEWNKSQYKKPGPKPAGQPAGQQGGPPAGQQQGPPQGGQQGGQQGNFGQQIAQIATSILNAETAINNATVILNTSFPNAQPNGPVILVHQGTVPAHAANQLFTEVLNATTRSYQAEQQINQIQTSAGFPGNLAPQEYAAFVQVVQQFMIQRGALNTIQARTYAIHVI